MSDPSDCAGCGAPLPAGAGVRDVTCGYCDEQQEHPRPVSARQEVMLSDGFDGYELGTVVACDGPDAISVQTERDTASVKVEDLVMVTRERVQAGDRVYAKRQFGWELVYVASVDAERVTVKNASDDFGDSFFDDVLPQESIRVPVDRARRTRRSAAHMWLARVASDPFDLLFKLVFYSFALAFLGLGLWLAGMFIRAFVGW